MSNTGASDQSLWQLPAQKLLELLHAKEVSPVEILSSVFARSGEVNSLLNALVTPCEQQAYETAKTAEKALLRGEASDQCLVGIPYTVKDLTETEGVRTTFGSTVFADHVPKEDAIVVERMRKSGAVMIGKTNTPQDGCKGVTDNFIFGRSYNPWNLERTPGGSSGGAAAAVASGIAPLADANDFAGSTRIPAAYCGLVGYKAPKGRVPVYPNDYIWHPIENSHGPITRTVGDAALMMNVIHGADPRDPGSSLDGSLDYVAFLEDFEASRDLRIGWIPSLGYCPLDEDVESVLRRSVTSLSSNGFRISEERLDLTFAIEAYGLLNSVKRASIIDADIDREDIEIDPLMILRHNIAGRNTGVDVGHAIKAQSDLFRILHDLFNRYDLLLLPTTPTTAFDIELQYPSKISGIDIPTPFHQLIFTFIFNMTGLPAMSIPAGWTREGLPVGLQIVGSRTGERDIFRLARFIEVESPWIDRWPALPEKNVA